MKSWKSLFIKNEEEEATKKESTTSSESFSFPLQPAPATPQPEVPSIPVSDPAVNEVLQVYENGLDSINMPGYDFYEFYKTVVSTGNPSEQTYMMAFQMAKTLDKTISPAKLLGDAEFYISKINEVHSQYVGQGQQKLTALQEKRSGEKLSLQKEIDGSVQRIAHLRAELQKLENELTMKRNQLSRVDEGHQPQEKSIREKLNANDIARKTSIDKLNMIKEGIQRYIK